MLSGVGDPSGCGEGFSYLTRQAEQAKATSSLTSSEKIVAARSVKKVTGTNGDLRFGQDELDRCETSTVATEIFSLIWVFRFPFTTTG